MYQEQKITYVDGTPYIDNRPDYSNSAFSQLGQRMNLINEKTMPMFLQSKQLVPFQTQIQQPQTQPQQSMSPLGTQAFQNKLNNLTINASDALYGGLLGYNPKPIVSPTGNTYSPPNPNGGFRFPFGLLNGMGGQ